MKGFMKSTVLVALLAAPALSATVCDITDYGAKDDGSDSSPKIMDAFDQCVKSGASLLVPKGKNFTLVTKTELHGKDGWKFDIQGVLKMAGPSETDLGANNNSTGMGDYFIDIKGADLEVSGRGMTDLGIDGNGAVWWEKFGKKQTRPGLLMLTGTKGTKKSTVHDIYIMNSPFHTMKLLGQDIEVYNYKLTTVKGSHNTDGFGTGGLVATKNVHLHDCDIQNNDDCVAVKNLSTDITVENIRCEGSHGMSIGSVGYQETADVSGVTFSNIDMYPNSDSSSMNGARIKTVKGGKGKVSDITFENFTINDVPKPIVVDQQYCDTSGGMDCTGSDNVKIDNVTFRNFTGSTSKKPIDIECKSGDCTNFTVEDINVTSKKSNVCTNVTDTNGKALSC